MESVFSRLFEGISLSAEQQATARALLAQLAQAEIAQADSARPATLAFMTDRSAVLARRDSALIGVPSSETDRSTLRTRLVAGDGRGQRAGGPDSAAGQRSGGRSTQPPGGGRGGGRSGGNVPLDFGALLTQVVDNLFHRWFDGIALTPDQEENARTIITKAQTELSAIRPPPPSPAILRQLPRFGFDSTRTGPVVMISEAGEAALIAVVTNDADREMLRRRMLVGGRLFVAPRPPQ